MATLIQIKSAGLTQLKKKLRDQPALVVNAVEVELRISARDLCTEYARITSVEGLGDGGENKIKRKISRDVRRVFPQASDLYAWILRTRGREMANLFWRAHKQKKARRITQILNELGLARGIDDGMFKQLRGIDGSIQPSVQPHALVTPARQKNYIERRNKKTGTAKAGWYVAARKIGGRLRTRVKSAEPGGARGKSVNRFPKYVRRHGRNKNLGDAQTVVKGSQVSILVRNNVNYGGRIMEPGGKAEAEARAARKTAEAIRIRIEKGSRSKFNRRHRAA